jgi:hypothetical protein
MTLSNDGSAFQDGRNDGRDIDQSGAAATTPSTPPTSAPGRDAQAMRRGRKPLSNGPKQQEAFQVWAENGGRNWQLIAEKTGISERTLLRWANLFSWSEKLLERESQIYRESEERIVAERRKRLDDQLTLGTTLRRRAFQYLLTHEIEKTSDAIAAARVGIEIERQADTLPTYLLEIACATPDQLTRRIDEMEAQRNAAIANGTFTPTPPDDVTEDGQYDYSG